MYQMIDAPDDEEAGEYGRFSPWPFLIGALLAALVFAIVWLSSPGQSTQPGRSIETPASRAAYLKALSEPNPAFRRARLLDYQRTHPDTDRSEAVEDQLAVIDASETVEWEAVTRAVYDVRADEETKRAALAEYEARWNGRLLGGRGDELEVLRQAIDEDAEAEPLPDRTMEVKKSPISTAYPSDALAGGPPIVKAPVLVALEPAPPPVAEPVRKDVVVPASIRRNVSPRYPRKAQRRKVDAIVTLSLYINPNGRVALTEVVEVEAERYAKDFVKAAERAALKTRFNPKTINGRPVPASNVRKRYIFRSSR